VAAANERGEVDTLLLVRGGGSIEDLWSFNDEQLARQVAQSAIPVISGVGHETDFTIVDFVADVRAPTPTAAAELACAPRSELLRQLGYAAQALARVQRRRLEQAAQRLDRASAQLVSPVERLARQRERLALLAHRLSAAWRAPQSRRAARLELLAQRLSHRVPDTARAHERLKAMGERMRRGQAGALQAAQARLAAAHAQLRAFDPGNTLARGYAIVRDAQGGVVRDAGQLSAGQALDLTFARGGASADITQVRRD
jgi:exodeoxyribonuclease VII large subunit